jgi:AraC-like DNA-binding protein
MLLENIVQSYIETGIFVSAFFVIKEILHKKLGFHLWFALIAFLFQIKISFLINNSSLPSPWVFLFSITALFLVGPVQYSQTLRLFGKFNFRELYSHYSLCLISIPIEVLIIIYFPKQIPEIGVTTVVGRMLSVSGLLYYFLYFYCNQRLFQNFLKQYKIEHSQSVISYNWMVASFMIFACMSIFFSNKILFQMAGILITTGAFVTILYFTRYPDFFDTISEEVAKQKYEKTSLSDLDLEKIKLELEILMKEKKYYQDDEIYLDDIANELMINKNQLSRVLNEIYNKNFYQFINSYRIAEAKELMIQYPSRTILEIAYEVGFKSKSAFYKNFFEQTNLTPQEFKKRANAS